MKKGNWRLVLLSIIGIALAVTAQSASADEFDADTVATVGQQNIGLSELKDYLIAARKRGRPTDILHTMTLEGKEKVLRQIIDQKLLALEAETIGLKSDPVVKRALERVIEALLAEYLWKQEQAKINLSDEGLRGFYTDNPNLFRTTGRVKARHINTRTRQDAEQALAEIKKGQSFRDTAEKYNIDKSRSDGGSLGWVTKGIMVQPFDSVLFSLKEGEISDIIHTSFGYHIIKAEKIDQGTVKPFETVREDVRKMIIARHMADYKTRLELKYPVYINRKLLEQPDM